MKTSGPVPLAIIIPAYKARFLRETLESVASQTDRNFQLYVGDDCSPEPVGEIVREFSGKLDIQYHRFETNLGGISLPRHWERCFRLCAEPWIWCFADDDCMEPGCVAAFFDELKKTEGAHAAYRFNTLWIDGASRVISESPSHPVDESGGDFLRARLRDQRNSTFQELIFSRSAWESSGGVPDFPMAWCSDDAFIARLGRQQPIHLIPGPRVRWRLSDVNISNNMSSVVAAKKITAAAEFARWTADYFRTDKTPDAESVALTEHWFKRFVAGFERFLGWKNSRDIEHLATGAWHQSAGAGLWWAFKNNCAVAGIKFQRKILGRR